jgi:NAD(P)-dependent dehydrogenase (short-subunit alcohol dehydrogenase family)
MKVVITGNANGIGKAIYEKFKSDNWICLGFDAENGKDVNDTQVIEELLLECQTADVFINNALANQVELLQRVHDMWLGKDKVIVNLSSAVTYKYTPTQYPPEFFGYYQHKQKLDELCKELTLNRLPYILNVRPAWVDTKLAEHITDFKINAEHLADLIYYHIQNKEKYQVIDIVIR